MDDPIFRWCRIFWCTAKILSHSWKRCMRRYANILHADLPWQFKDCLSVIPNRYRVFLKKVFHKREEKMQEKMKMTLQKDENLVQVQQRYSVYYCIKTFFKSWFVWLVWPFECLILMILTMTNYHENSLRDGPLSLLSIIKFFSSLKTKKVLKVPNEPFLRITRYFHLNNDDQWITL